MMKILKYSMLAVIMAAVLPTSASAKGVVLPKGYLFGFIANFTDSVVYFTDVQEVDSIWYDKSSHFLLGRDIYANQLRNYFTEDMKMPHRTCIVSFGLSRKDAEKKLVKMRKLYTDKKKGNYEVRNLNENQFRFSTVNMEETIEAPMTKAEKEAATEARKKAELKAKAAKKEAKKARKEAEKAEKEAAQARKEAREAAKEARKQSAKARKAQKDMPGQRPLDPNLPPAEVEMRE
jgi:flagellar biosynthesis GTPase FlhF